MKAWKGKEMQFTHWLSRGVMKAFRRSNEQVGLPVEDIDFGPGFLGIELKTRGVIPKTLKDWTAQAKRNAEAKGLRWAVIIHEDGARMGTQYVIMQADQWWTIINGFAKAAEMALGGRRTSLKELIDFCRAIATASKTKADMDYARSTEAAADEAAAAAIEDKAGDVSQQRHEKGV